MDSSLIPNRIAMPCPFAGDGATLGTIDDISSNNMNFPKGFPTDYGAPTSTSGKFVTRGEMNRLGNISTTDAFVSHLGVINTFDADFCVKIGGYPKGIVLDYLVDGKFYKVQSLVDNNKVDFTGSILTQSQISSGITSGSIDNIYWMALNQENAQYDGSIIYHHSVETLNAYGVYFNPFYHIVVPRSGSLVIRNCKGGLFQSESTQTLSYVSAGGYVSCFSSVGVLAKISNTELSTIEGPDFGGTSPLVVRDNGWMNVPGFVGQTQILIMSPGTSQDAPCSVAPQAQMKYISQVEAGKHLYLAFNIGFSALDTSTSYSGGRYAPVVHPIYGKDISFDVCII